MKFNKAFLLVSILLFASIGFADRYVDNQPILVSVNTTNHVTQISQNVTQNFTTIYNNTVFVASANITNNYNISISNSSVQCIPGTAFNNVSMTDNNLTGSCVVVPLATTTLPSGNISGTFSNTSITSLDANKLVNILFLNFAILLRPSNITGDFSTWNGLFNVDWSNITNKPTIPAATTSLPYGNITGTPTIPNPNGVTIPAANITNGTFPTGNWSFAGGNVGIGTTSPVSALNIVANGASNALGQLQISTTGTANTGFSFDGGPVANAFSYMTADTTIKFAALIFRDRTDTANSFAEIATGRGNNSQPLTGMTRNDFAIFNAATNKSLFFGTNDGTGAAIKMTILGNGNVGINTSSPSALLDVHGNAMITGTVSASNLNGVTIPVANVSDFNSYKTTSLPYSNITGTPTIPNSNGVTIPEGTLC